MLGGDARQKLRSRQAAHAQLQRGSMKPGPVGLGAESSSGDVDDSGSPASGGQSKVRTRHSIHMGPSCVDSAERSASLGSDEVLEAKVEPVVLTVALPSPNTPAIPVVPPLQVVPLPVDGSLPPA